MQRGFAPARSHWNKRSAALIDPGGGSWMPTERLGWRRRTPSRRSLLASARTSISRRCWRVPITSRWPATSRTTGMSRCGRASCAIWRWRRRGRRESRSWRAARCRLPSSWPHRRPWRCCAPVWRRCVSSGWPAWPARPKVQGGLLTVEDLAFLTCSSPATVNRDLAECRVNDIAVPTRGQIRDIGPGVSHKAQVVQLYLLAFNRGVARHNADPGPAARRLGLIAHFDGFAERYQSEDIAQFARRSADLTFDRVAAFMEMCPALVVDRDRDSRSQFTAQLDGVARGHGVSNRPGDRELHPAHVHDRNVDVESIGNLADAVVEHGVA